MWMNFGIKDLIDVLLVAFFLYQTYKLMKSSGTLGIFSGVVSFVVVWILMSQILEMRLMGAILDKFISVGFVVLIVLFQDEIRRFLLALGSHKGWKFLAKLFSAREDTGEKEGKYIAPVVLSCVNMARKKTGALIVVERDMVLALYEHTGLHDGAMIISDNKIRAAGCILPVAQNANIPKELGLRHRSGLGMSMETDAMVIIVSEERGRISVAHLGNLCVNVSAEELQQILSGEREVTNFC